MDEAVRLTTAISEALEAAHEQGVVHRDIKPANILLSRGSSLVADFRIALAVSSSGAYAGAGGRAGGESWRRVTGEGRSFRHAASNLTAPISGAMRCWHSTGNARVVNAAAHQ